MNANELANFLETDCWYKLITRQEIATMLRGQQAEIEALKKDNKELHAIAQRMAMAESDARKSLQWYKDARERQSEPVAWMEIEYGGFTEYKVWREPVSSKSIPLYTHPVKELTDEEIEQLLKQHDWYSKTWVDMVRSIESAILRKAQE